MSRDIVALGDMRARMPEQGRIRIGKKVATNNGKERPTKLKFFRFTSQDEGAIKEIAARYGGDAKPWTGAPNGEQFEVFTLANEIPIVLPPSPLGDSPTYEEWSGGGIKRRCDGVTMQVPRPTEDGAEMVEEPCACKAAQRLSCKVTTRLNVILRDVRFGGTWRIETHGWYAAYELPGMVAMLEVLQSQGIMDGLLQLGEFSKVVQTPKGVQTRKWMVPKVTSAHSVAAIASGQARLAGLAPAPQQALSAGPDVVAAPDASSPEALGPAADIGDGSDWLVDDNDIADAEIVDEEPSADPGVQPETAAPEGGEGAGSPPAGSPPPPLEPDPDEVHGRMLRRMHALIKDVRAKCDASVSADDWRHAMVGSATRGAKHSSGDLTDDELRVMLDLLEDLKEGRRRFGTVDLTMNRVRMSGLRSVS